jgi:beta-lactamase class A
MKTSRVSATLFPVLCLVATQFIASGMQGATNHAATKNLGDLIVQRMQEFGATGVAIYLEDPDNHVYSLNSDEIFHAASTMKVPVMMEIFRQVENGTLKLDQPVVVKNEFASIMDGSPFSLTAEEDTDTGIYKMIGQTLTLRELVERMINQSSNLSTNIVIQIAGPQNVMDLMKEIGANGMTVLRGVEDIKAYDAGKNNTTSARALATCLKAISNSKLFSESSRQEMFRILLSQHSKTIGKGIHADENGFKVASKDGWITEIHHDAAIIQDSAGKNTILVILTKGVKEEKRGEELVETLAADIWKAISKQ